MATQTSTAAADLPEAPYRPISNMAVICFVLGLLSPLAFAGQIWWFLPLLGFILSAWTTRKLEEAKSEYAGQVLAKIGLLLSLVCGLGGVTQYYVRYWLITSDARSTADQALDFVLTNQVKQAFELTQRPIVRAGTADVDSLIGRRPEDYRSFVSSTVVDTFRGKLAEAQVIYDGVVAYDVVEALNEVALRYRIRLGSQLYEVVMILQGGVAPGGEWQGRQWYVKQSEARPITE